MLVQVVFLIDTDIDRCYKDSPVLLSNAVCRSCFRLLHHFSSTFEKRGTVGKSRLSQTNVKWGYKFFSRRVGQSRIESHRLYDFKLKYFEEFENDVNQRFECCYNLQRNSVLKSVKPVDSLNRAFTELLADFQWENPDLLSPVKGRRNKKEHFSSNHVFLFSKCPKNGIELKEFTGKQVPDEDVLLYSMFPNTLFQQFCQVTRLSMHWIDTEHISFLTKPDLQSVQIVEKAVNKAGGSLTVLDAIVKHGNHHFTDAHLFYDEEATEQEVASYICKNGSNMSGLIPNTSFIDSLLSREVMTDKKSLKHKNNEVTLQLGNQQFLLSLKAVDKGNRINRGNTRMIACFNDGQNPCNTPDIKHLQGYGLLPKHSVGSLGIALQSCYLCTPVNSVPGKKLEKNNAGKFIKLLSTLVAEDLVMVLLSEFSGHFVLLSPITVHTATMSIVSMEKSLMLEKQMLLSNGRSCQTLSRESCQHEDLIDRLVSSVRITKQNDPVENAEVSHFDGRQMDRWIIPGQTETLQRLVTKLYSRISDLDFLSPDETGLLKELQKCYKQHNKPPGLRDTVVPTSNHDALREANDQFELPYKGKSSRMSLSRIDMILCKSKAVVRERGQTKEDTKSEDKVDRNKMDVAAHLTDFSSVEELKHYLVSSYERVTSGEISSIDSTVQSMVTGAHHYMKQTHQTDDVEKCIKLLEETVIMTGAMLREKFINLPDVTVEQKLAEYETQVLLRIEMISSLHNKDQTEDEEGNEEIVGFLRALSFISEPGLLSKFMESCLVSNYIHSIPQTLANLFDELMQPLPEVLANILSPENASPTRSVLNDSLIGGPPSTRTRSHDSVGPTSSQLGSQSSFNLDTSLNKSRGGRKLVHHYSVDLGTKRQIVVDKIPNKKTEKLSSKKKASHKQSKERVAKALFGKQRDKVKLERRQSVAVMQHANKTPKKQQLHKSPRRYASPRRKLVAETPTHKQVSHIMKKESLIRRHSLADEIVTGVVAESPEKACDTSMKESPTKGKRTKALLRRSFYSAGPVKRTKNLTQYFQLADRIAGRKRQASGSDDNKPAKLLKLEPSSQFKSPDKNSSFLLSQLVASPSPAKTTPRKRNMTPQKLLGSPSQYTRSKLGMSPSIDLYRSPSRRQKIASPAPHVMESPITRRHSPRILVADSDVKDGPKSPVATPEKSPVCGVVPFGLDSPSQNTRQKISQTPTRRSVRAALFAKSPATSRRESPFRGTASPRTLLQKFGSPLKNAQELGNNTKCSTGQVDGTNLKLSSSHIDNVNDQNEIHGQTIRPLRGKVAQQVCFNNFETEQMSDHPQTVKTPPGKKMTKTPDSFDKWHRRKPRMSQNSPSTNKIAMETKIDKIHGIRDIVNDNKVNMDDSLSARNRGMSRNKRSLVLSPDKTLNPSNKRRRTLKSELGFSTGSQGFDVSSFDELSQMSTASSLDYFSSTNDDVFLSQNNELMDFESTENENRSSGCLKNNSILKNKAFDRLQIQSDNVPVLESSQPERSDSPIFGCSKAIRTRNRSGNFEILNTVSNVGSFQCGASIEQNSPKPVGHSPGTKKFSPNVSAKSLMHLIQSPLLKSSNTNSNKSDKLKNSHIGERSRRSLKLQN